MNTFADVIIFIWALIIAGVSPNTESAFRTLMVFLFFNALLTLIVAGVRLFKGDKNE